MSPMPPLPLIPDNIQSAYLDLCQAFSCLINREAGSGAGPRETGRAARLILDAIAVLVEEYPDLRSVLNRPLVTE